MVGEILTGHLLEVWEILTGHSVREILTGYLLVVSEILRELVSTMEKKCHPLATEMWIW